MIQTIEIIRSKIFKITLIDCRTFDGIFSVDVYFGVVGNASSYKRLRRELYLMGVETIWLVSKRVPFGTAQPIYICMSTLTWDFCGMSYYFIF